MNDLRKDIIKELQKSDKPLTLKEIAERLGIEKINSGSVNALVENGILVNGEKKKVAVVKYDMVNTYAIGDLTKLNKTE